MIKVGDKVRILENAVVGSDNITIIKFHNFAIGSIAKVLRVHDQNNIFAIGKYEDSDFPIGQWLVNTEDLKQFEEVTDVKVEE